MKTIQKISMRYLLAALFISPLITFAQDPAGVEMADTFRSEGKIYVVIAVMAIILAGLFIYLFALGKKVSDLEKKINGKH